MNNIAVLNTVLIIFAGYFVGGYAYNIWSFYSDRLRGCIKRKNPRDLGFSRKMRDLPTPTDAELAECTELFGGMTIEELVKTTVWIANRGVNPLVESSKLTGKQEQE